MICWRYVCFQVARKSNKLELFDSQTMNIIKNDKSMYKGWGPEPPPSSDKPANSSDYPTLSSAVNQTTIRCLINFRCIPARLLALIQWSRSCIQSLKVYNIHMVSVITNMKFVYNETNKLTLHKYHMSRARRLLPAVSDPCGIYVLCTSHWCCIQIS